MELACEPPPQVCRALPELIEAAARAGNTRLAVGAVGELARKPPSPVEPTGDWASKHAATR